MLFIGPGNGYGLLGHVALRNSGQVYGFWMIGCSISLESMPADEFFKLYTDYEERDILGIELNLEQWQLSHLRTRLLEELGHPFSHAPRYNIFTNNCITSVYVLLSECISRDKDAGKLGMPTTRGLAKWIRAHLDIRCERFYPSYRHLLMFEKTSKGESVAKDLIVPLSDCDSHSYSCWRLVYTEDLDGVSFLLRPIGGACNIIAGAAQTVWGVIALPVKGFKGCLRGLASTAAAIPELVGISIRRAGKASPMSVIKLQKILDDWKPLLRQKKKKREQKAPAEKMLGNSKRKRLRLPLSRRVLTPEFQ